MRQCGQWLREGLTLQVSVNISARDLMNRELPEHVAELLAEHDVTPGLLCLEITESGFMEDPAHAQKVLDRLAELGVKLSIDDYGTGYSSLSYIMKLPVQELKIDQSFISRMATDEEISTIVRSTIDLGHNLGLQVVAEGVEDLRGVEHAANARLRRRAGLLHEQAARARERWRRWIRANASSGLTATSNAAEAAASMKMRKNSLVDVGVLDIAARAHRGKAAPVQRARAQRIERGDVRGRGISLVPGQ